MSLCTPLQAFLGMVTAAPTGHWGAAHTSFSRAGTSPFWSFLWVQGRKGLSEGREWGSEEECRGAPGGPPRPGGPCSATQKVLTPTVGYPRGKEQCSPAWGPPRRMGCWEPPTVVPLWSELCLSYWGARPDSEFPQMVLGPRWIWGALCGIPNALVKGASCQGRKWEPR